MTIQDLGSVGEFVAAIATIATLLYLAQQIRQNTRATRAASFQAVSDSMNHVNVAVAQTPELAAIWVRGCADRSVLSDPERHQFDMLLLSYFHVFETIDYQAKVGAGESSLVSVEERSLRALLQRPGVLAWWAENPYAYGPDFRSYVDGLIAGKSAS